MTDFSGSGSCVVETTVGGDVGEGEGETEESCGALM